MSRVAAQESAPELKCLTIPGKFRDKMRAAEEERASLNESITVRQSAEAGSHTAGFEAWLRSRGDIKVRLCLFAPRHECVPDTASRSSRAMRWQTSTA